MKVLVIGSGGREHAIAWKLKQSRSLTALYCAPGNAGTASIAKNIPISVTEIDKLLEFAESEQIDLTVVGPEAPLEAGIVNKFELKGLRIFGPTREAAQLEWSKSFAKEIMLAAKVPTAQSEVFEDLKAAQDYVKGRGVPIVIKADGLAAGKGVTVALTMDQALQALSECLADNRFGSAGARVLIEDFLSGKEASVMAIVDGHSVFPLAISQDYKRQLTGDKGPNTGGMGAISPTPVIGENRLDEIIKTVFYPVVSELQDRGITFRGFLYAGLMVADDGSFKVLEFNCRLGDPETQVLMPRLRSDLLEVLCAALGSGLSASDLIWRKESCAGVVLASAGYPDSVDDGKEILGLELDSTEEIQVFHSGTYLSKDGKVISKGGRVLVVSALGGELPQALKSAYGRIKQISFQGMQFRSDIGNS